MLPRPTAVKAAACSASSRIFRSTVASSPCDAPPKTVTVTRPPVACFHSSAICLRFLSQMEPSGTTVASLIARCANEAFDDVRTHNVAVARITKSRFMDNDMDDDISDFRLQISHLRLETSLRVETSKLRLV